MGQVRTGPRFKKLPVRCMFHNFSGPDSFHFFEIRTKIIKYRSGPDFRFFEKISEPRTDPEKYARYGFFSDRNPYQVSCTGPDLSPDQNTVEPDFWYDPSLFQTWSVLVQDSSSRVSKKWSRTGPRIFEIIWFQDRAARTTLIFSKLFGPGLLIDP